MESTPPLTVDFYVRADAPIREQRDAVIEQLTDLEGKGHITGFSVHPWPRAVSLDLVAEIDDDGILGEFESFETWADRNGIGIRPPFDVRTSHSVITDETHELLVLPVMCLAVYSDDDLVGMYPCSDDESVLTIDDAFDAITTGDIIPPPPESSSGDGSLELGSGRGDTSTSVASERPNSNGRTRLLTTSESSE